MSRIRTNLITNRMANGAPTVSNGLVISGVTTSTSFVGDGSALTGITQTTINNNADNRVITGSGTANTLEAESTLTFNAGTLTVNALNSLSGSSIITYSPNSSVRYQMGVSNTDGVSLLSKNTSGSYNTYKIDAGNFTVRTTGTNSPADRFTIDGNGNIGLNGITNPSSYDGWGRQLVLGSTTGHGGLTIVSGNDSGEYGHLLFADGTGGDGSPDQEGRIGYEHNSNFMYFATNNTERVRITSDGHTLFSGLTLDRDSRNAKGITIKSPDAVSFATYGSNGSRNWRIRPDDQSRWGDLDFSVSPTANSATDWPDAAADKVLTLGYDGTVSKPRNPLFVAQKSGAITGTGFVTFATVIENVGSCYDSSNGRFTAPVAGYYWFCIKINAYKRIDFFLKRNGSNSGNSNREIGQFNTSDQNGWYSHNLIRIFELAANDYVQVDVTYLTQNTDPNEWITFQGYLLQ